MKTSLKHKQNAVNFFWVFTDLVFQYDIPAVSMSECVLPAEPF